jgi:hypothetical protein
VSVTFVLLQRGRPVQVQWGNELVDSAKRYQPHIFADQLNQTLHW